MRRSVGCGPYSVTPGVSTRPPHNRFDQILPPLVEGRKGRGQPLSPATSLAQGGEEFHCRPGASDSLVIERSRFHALGRGVGRRSELRRVEGFKAILPSEEDTDVRTVKLVRRAREEIASDGSHVDQVVRGVVHGVHEA